MPDIPDPAATSPQKIASKPAPKSKAIITDIQVTDRNSNILLIAPHACVRDDEPKDDENTGPITEWAAQQLGCSAIINTLFHKPKKPKYPRGLKTHNLDLNVIKDADLVPGYLDFIRGFVDRPGKTTVIWIHGADTDKAQKVAKHAQYDFQPANIESFIGYGQGKAPKETATKEGVLRSYRPGEL